MTTTLRGKAAHSSVPARGVSAIAHAMALISWHGVQMAKQERGADAANGFFPAFTTLQVGIMHAGTSLNTVPDECIIQSDIRYVPPQTAEQWIVAYRAEAAQAERAMQAEAGHFQGAGYSTVVCGPGCIAQAHQADEIHHRR